MRRLDRGMKAILLSLFVALLMVGCGEEAQTSESVDMTDTDPEKDAIETAVDWSKLQDRDGVTYLPNTQEPFSGYAKRAYENEQIKELAQFKDGYVVRIKKWYYNGTPKREATYKDGKREGLATEWYEDGLKKEERTYKDGKREGLTTEWYPNGQKVLKQNYKDGKLEGLRTEWHPNGQKLEEGNWKDDEQDGLWTDWYENGQKKSEENWKDGKLDGISIYYKKDGTEWYRTTYKDGVEVED